METLTSIDLSYTKDEISAGAKRKQYEEGWYQLLLTDSTLAESSSETKNLMFVQQWVPLKVEGDPDSKGGPSVRNYLTIPMKNPRVPGHKAPTHMSQMAHGHMLALGAEGVVDLPRKVDDTFVFKGEEIPPDLVKDARDTAIETAVQRLVALAKDPGSFRGYVCYGRIVKDGEYNKIKSFRAELPDTATLLPPEEWFGSTEESES